MKRHSLDSLSASPWPAITARISEQTGRAFVAQQITPVGGGCINRAYRIQGPDQQFFVKLNQAHYLPMFEAEAAGLEEIRHAAALHAPQPLGSGCGEGHAWLVLEFLDLRGQGDD